MAASGEFFTLDQIKAHLRVTDTAEDAAIQLYAELAQGLIVDRLERATTDSVVLGEIGTWDDETAPAAIRAAVLVQCAELYGRRGDEMPPVESDGRLSMQVERLLGPWLERPLA